MGLNQSQETVLLSETQVAFFLLERGGWSVVEGTALRRTFEFPGLMEAVEFVAEVAAAAETTGHRPDLDINETGVTVTISSPGAHGLTNADTMLVALIEELGSEGEPADHS